MRFIVYLIIMLAVALGVGFGTSYYALTDGRLFGAIRIGPWAGWSEIGTENPDPYSRAYLARTGLLQLGKSEGIRFVARTDSEGDRLERACSYAVTGQTPGATFWTLLAADPEGATIAAAPGLSHFHSERIVYDPDGVTLNFGPQMMPGNWLPTNETGPFTFVMTLYDAAGLAGGGSNVSTLPAIERVACP
ncbi:DUF1214 domain-containing protein [Pelagibacterium xiamenense]|uniref:DUF1214 domain-containing protein n=1 Tax=Pelagibacterium xiamenense TaxID=2901140 RepID=UPI001E642EDB|nr:DUF1214 domain-containing protein [Pelagibacterium xiamenense]MCD7059436.1 DUF1214 domain-containing protein [Pelagibacterium xiamenense]